MGRARLNIGEVPSGSTAIPIHHCDELESIPIGTVIAPLNDYQLVWDEDCLVPSKLEPWRHLGDPLCDDVVRTLGIRAGQDGLQLILDHLARPEADQEECVKQFWAEIARDPPSGVSALPAPPAREASPYSPHTSIRFPDYRPPATLAEGQAVFWRYTFQIFAALRHFSLAGGFSANRIMNVLRETNYLTGDARDRTFKRLLETTQAIMDYMNDMTPVTGIGWKSAIRVRLLHSSVRIRLIDGKGMLKVYDVMQDGIPINQEDMLATLGSFAIAPLWSLRRMGFTLSSEEQEAYVACWRHIGYYLGIPSDKLTQYYSSVNRAEKLFASSTMHLFANSVIADDYRTTHTFRLLSATSGRPPRFDSLESSLALSRYLLGDGLADRLALPPIPLWESLQMHMGFYAQRAMRGFGRYYSTRWEVERVESTRTLFLMVICGSLGKRRTKFTIKEFAEQLEQIDLGTNKSGNAEKEKISINPDDDELDPEVRLGPEAGKAMVKRYKWLFLEMGAVVLGFAVGGVAFGYMGVQLYRLM